jgi:hypothetical protein
MLPDPAGVVPEEAERLADDTDRAARVSDQLACDALASHRARAARAASQQQPGICTNCRERCLPLAVFCDVHCREDYEHRMRLTRRLGGG